jgi:glycosyltransferase involved in cell wall biosynthesis
VTMNCAVVTPVYLSAAVQLAYLREMVGTLVDQTDGSWHLVLVDDASPLHDAANLYSELSAQLKDQITVIRLKVNSGQGICRNIGARWAWRRGLPYCLYLDCDDRSDLRRVATVRSVFDEDPGVDFVYSSFDLIDENGQPVAEKDITPSIKEITDAHRAGGPPRRAAGPGKGTMLGVNTMYSVV